MPVGGLYAQQSDLEATFGTSNIATWSQLDGQADPTGAPVADTVRIQAAFNYADAVIISYFLNYGNYSSPLQPQNTDVTLVNYWDCVIAGEWLYKTRGVRDTDKEGDHMTQLLVSVMKQMDDYRSQDKLQASRRWPTPTAPSTSF